MVWSRSAHKKLSPLRGSVLGLRSAIKLALVVLVAANMVSTASASCGNYLFRNGKPVSNHAMTVDQSMAGQSVLDQKSVVDVASGDSDAVVVPVEIPVRRCSGPNCSGNSLPLAPVPAVPTSLLRGVDQATLLECLTGSPSPRGAIEIPQSERGACYEPSCVFRPPAGC